MGNVKALRAAVTPLLFFVSVFFCWGQTTQQVVPTEKNPDLLELSAFGGIGLFGGLSQAGFSEKLAAGGTAGGRAAYNFSQHFSLEGNYSFSVNNARLTPANFGNQIQSFAIDAVYNFTARGSRIRPYVTAGLGPSWFVPVKQAEAALGVGKSTELTFNYGGGVKYHLTPHLGLRLDARGVFERNPSFGLANVPAAHLNGLQATLGLVFYFWQAHALVPVAAEPKPLPTLQPLNPGEITGGAGQLCQGRVLTLHATATDPAGHPLSYLWKANGQTVGTNNPDLSYAPNNAGDFEFEVEVSDASDSARIVRSGPKTFAIQDYAQPKIKGVTASPNEVNITSESPASQTVILAADVAASPCGGNLTYKWSVSEGRLTSATGPSAVFDTASLNFETGLGQTKTITATVTATDETGQSVSQSGAFTVDFPAQFKRLSDVVFARNSARVNNCGKRILIEQAAPQAGSAFDIVLVGHRSADEMESLPVKGRQRASQNNTLDRARLLAVAAVLTGDHRLCGNLDASQIRISPVGTEQISQADPGLCGTSNISQVTERVGAQVTQADTERRVEVYLVPKGSQVLPPSAHNAVLVTVPAVKALGCPK